MEKHEIKKKLSTYGYIHVDVWLRCPKCGHAMSFGKELEDKSVMVFSPNPENDSQTEQITKAFNKHTNITVCPICNSDMRLHKIFLRTISIEGADEETFDINNASRFARARFWVKEEGDKLSYKICKFIESGVLAQFKCNNFRCQYVRYTTL